MGFWIPLKRKSGKQDSNLRPSSPKAQGVIFRNWLRGVAGGFSWLIVFVWAVWPTDKSLIDPIAGNVTGKGNRNSGDTFGSLRYGNERGYLEEKYKDNKR